MQCFSDLLTNRYGCCLVKKDEEVTLYVQRKHMSNLFPHLHLLIYLSQMSSPIGKYVGYLIFTSTERNYLPMSSKPSLLGVPVRWWICKVGTEIGCKALRKRWQCFISLSGHLTYIFMPLQASSHKIHAARVSSLTIRRSI